MEELVRSAWEEGQKIDLSGVGYGRIHWGNFRDEGNTPYPYYFFLAGLVRLTKSLQICEIGTHSGGSAISMAKGMYSPENGRIVTIDITRESNKYLRNYKNIIKIRGDSNKRKIIWKIINDLSIKKFDLLYIDAHHDFMDTMMSYSIYSNFFKPDLIILDDIRLNESMRECWSHLTDMTPKEDIVDAVDIVPEIRPDKVGFGVLRPSYARVMDLAQSL